jgi:hypothetical protein
MENSFANHPTPPTSPLKSIVDNSHIVSQNDSQTTTTTTTTPTPSSESATQSLFNTQSFGNITSFYPPLNCKK